MRYQRDDILPLLPESLSESPSAGGPASGAWRPKSLSEIVGGR